MKDFHFLDGWIYFSRTTEGDVPVGTRDNNIYRMRTDGSSVENLSNLLFPILRHGLASADHGGRTAFSSQMEMEQALILAVFLRMEAPL